MAFMGIEGRDWIIGGACTTVGIGLGVGGTLLCQHCFGESKQDAYKRGFDKGVASVSAKAQQIEAAATAVENA